VDGGDCRGIGKQASRTQNPPHLLMIPSPREIFASFERGEIERSELQALMALHARELIQEMEEDHQNPAAAWIESLLARRAIGKLVRRHGARLIREVLIALAEVKDFPPSKYLWNAGHLDVPLHCFLRMRREPVFRILDLAVHSGQIKVITEFGAAAKASGTRRTFLLKRDERWTLIAQEC